MPKKFNGTNSKAVEAKTRKEAAKKAANALMQKELDDKYWDDDDSKLQKRVQKKTEKEQKKQQQIERKNELKLLEEQERNSFLKNTKQTKVETKMTRNEVEKSFEKLKISDANKTKKTRIQITNEEIPENINRLVDMSSVAQSVDEALVLLNQCNTNTQSDDKHPERRMKAAYLAFENEMIPKLKLENPKLKLSQIKQMVWKEWQKVNCQPK